MEYTKTEEVVNSLSEDRPRLAWRPRTYHFSFYNELSKTKNMSGHMHIFSLAATIGFLLDRKRKEQSTDNTEYILTTDSLFTPSTDEEIANSFKLHKEIVFDYIWTHYLTGTPQEKQHQLEEFADGGIEYMKEIFVGDNLPADKIISDIGEKFSTPKEQD